VNPLAETDQQKLRDTYLKLRNMRGGPGVRVHHERDSVVVSLLPGRKRDTPKRGTDVTVRIQEDHTGGGKYAGVILQNPTTTLTLTGTLAATDIGETSTGTTCIILNMNEIGSNTHWLTHADNLNQKTFNGRVIGYYSDGRPIVAINGFWLEVCEPEA
jgi:hypothetical protein